MHPIKRVLRFARKYWKQGLPALIFILIGESIGQVWPQLIRFAINDIEAHRYNMVPYIAAGYLGLNLLQGCISFSRGYLLNYVAQRTCYDIRNTLFDHIQRLSFSYHDEAETGQLISRSTSDVETLQQFLSEGLFFLVANPFNVIVILTILMFMNWRLALIAMSMMPILGVLVFKYSKKIGPLLADTQNQFGVMTSAIQQNALGIRVVKAFAREDYEISKFDKEAAVLRDKNIRNARISATYAPTMDFLAAISVVFVLWYGGHLVMSGRLPLGDLAAFITYVFYFVWPVRIMGYVAQISKNAVVSANRIFEVLDTHAETHLKDGKLKLKNCEGRVEFRNVSFHYHDGSKALSEVNLHVEPGQMVALVGGTGSGKSSIINLIPRFYDVTEGSVLIDGTDIREFKLSSLRKNIGIVAQETFLFGDTIYENIAYGRPGAPLEDVMAAAQAANIHEFIMTLPDQYDTRVGERGVNLSGGQKQRVAIARALLMNPPILILDDATSSVDTETEALIQKALVSLTESRTTFVIAQRGSTIKRAHKIVVLDKGRVVEIGTHNDLMAREGIYRELFELQFGGQELEVSHATTSL